MELHIVNILLISWNNDEKRAAPKIHVGADEKHDITKLVALSIKFSIKPVKNLPLHFYC